MANIASVSQSELGHRRRQLRQARRLRLLQACWQTLAVGSFAGGLVWVTAQPGWVIHKPDQVVIEGNQFLSAKTIRSLLPVSYPQSLLRLQPQEMAQKLERVGPIAKATVTRHLFPPGLTVQVTERYPVAIASTPASNDKALSATDSNQGVLDENGLFLPLTSYTSLDLTLQLPTLTIIGNPDDYRPYWPQVYKALSRSPVKIFELDWQNPGNLILKTELGIVHLGADNSKIVEKLNVLDRMRQLPNHISSGKIAYIDLKNPASPAIKMLQAPENVKPKTP